MSNDEYTREIARIESTMLGFEDHGILTCYLTLNFGNSMQGAGGYDLRPANGPCAAEWIERILKACDVQRWELLKGRTVYALRDKTRRVVGIEPLPTENGTRFLFVEAAK